MHISISAYLLGQIHEWRWLVVLLTKSLHIVNYIVYSRIHVWR